VVLDGTRGLHLVADEPELTRQVSDQRVVECIGACFARNPLPPAQLRDAKLVAFGFDLLYQMFVHGGQPLGVAGRGSLASFCGISGARVSRALEVLRQSGVIFSAAGADPGSLAFCDTVLIAATPSRSLDWAGLIPALRGRAVALLTLCACVDLVPTPWEWTPVTYGALARHACYSIGMIQSGLASLVKLGVLEQLARAGRGHDYRFSAWALGKAPAPKIVSPLAEASVRSPEARSSPPTVATTDRLSSSVNAAAESTMVVEIGGLVVRLPVGTEITMTVGADGTPVYAIGPDLMVRRQ